MKSRFAIILKLGLCAAAVPCLMLLGQATMPTSRPAPPADAYEPNNEFEKAAAIEVGKEIEGTLFPADDVDFYRFSVERASRVVITSTSPSRRIRLRGALVDANSRYVGTVDTAPGADLLMMANLPAGSYVLSLRHIWHSDLGGYYGDEKAGQSEKPYRLTVRAEPVPDALEPNDEATKASALELGKTCETWLFPARDRDWFRVKVPEPGRGELRVVASDVPENVALRAAIHYKDREIGAAQSPPGRPLVLRVPTGQAGDYQVVLSPESFYDQGRYRAGNEGSRQPVRFKVEYLDAGDEFEPNNDYPQAAALALGREVSASLFPAGDTDLYKLSVPQGTRGMLRVDVRGLPDSIHPEIALLDGKRSVIRAVATDRGQAATLVQGVGAGDYYLRIAARSIHNGLYHESGDRAASRIRYSLRTELTAATGDEKEPNDSFEQAEEIAVGQVRACTLLPEGDREFFRLKVGPDDPTLVQIVVAGLNPRLRGQVQLFNDKRQHLLLAHPQADTTLALSAFLTPGEYFVQVDASNYDNGKYWESDGERFQTRPFFVGVLPVYRRTVVVDAAPHHMGAAKNVHFAKPEPDGRVYRKTFEVREPAECDVVVITARGLGPMPLDRSSRLLVNGKAAAILNAYAVYPSYWGALLVDLPPGMVQAGNNEIAIEMPEYAADWEFQHVALGRRMDFRVGDKGLSAVTRAELGVVAQSEAASVSPLAAAKLEAGRWHELRLDRAGAARWYRIDATTRWMGRFLLPGPHQDIEPRATLYRVDGALDKPLPRVLYLPGPSGRTQLDDLFPELDITRIDAGAKEAAGALILPQQLEKYDAIILDTLTDVAQFDLATERVQATLRAYAQTGKRVLILDPCCDLQKIGIRLGAIRAGDGNRTIDVADAGNRFAGERGASMGWPGPSNGCRIENWKEAGLTALAMDLGDGQKSAVTAYLPVGQGAIVYETMLLGHPQNQPQARERLHWLLGLKTRFGPAGQSRRITNGGREQAVALNTAALAAGTYLLRVDRNDGAAASTRPIVMHADVVPLTLTDATPGAKLETAVEIAAADKPVTVQGLIDEPTRRHWFRVKTTAQRGANVRIECPEDLDVAVDLYRGRPGRVEKRVLYLVGVDGHNLDERMPDLTVERMSFRQAQSARALLDPARLRGYDAIVLDAAQKGQFGLDQKEAWANLEQYAKDGGRVIFLAPSALEELGVKREALGGNTRGKSLWMGDAHPWFSEYAGPMQTLHFASEHGTEYGAFSGWAAAGYAPLFRHADKPEEWATALARPVGKGWFVLDSQRFGGYDTRGSEWKLYFYVGAAPAVRFERTIDRTFGRLLGSPEQFELPPEDAEWVFCVSDGPQVHRSGEPFTMRVEWLGGAENAPAAGPVALPFGKTVEGRLYPSNQADVYRFTVEATGFVKFQAEHPADNMDLELALSREDQPVRKVLVLRGGRQDYNLARRRLSRVEFTEANLWDSRPWLERLAGFDAVVVDGLTHSTQYGLHRPEVQAAVMKYVEGGGTFILMCPQPADHATAKLFGVKVVTGFRKGTLFVADAEHPLHRRQGTGRLGGWHYDMSDSHGHYDGWKEAGFERVYGDTADKEKAATLIVKRVGKGMLILSALEVTHPYTEAGDWHLANLLDAPVQAFLDVRGRGQGNVPRWDQRILRPGNYLLRVSDSRAAGNYVNASPTPYTLRAEYASLGDITEDELAMLDAPAAAPTTAPTTHPSSDAGALLPGFPASVRIWPAGRTVWHRVAVTSPGRVTLSLSNVPDGLDPVMEIYKPGDLTRPWQRVDRSCGQAHGGPERFIFETAESQTLIVKVADQENGRSSMAAMQLKYEFAPVPCPYEFNNTDKLASVLVPDHAYWLNLYPAGDADWFRIEVAGKTMLQADCTQVPAEMAVRMEVFRAADVRYAMFSQTGKNGENVSLKRELPEAGTYYLALRPTGAASPDVFQFKASFTPAGPTTAPAVAGRWPAADVSGCAADAPLIVAFDRPVAADGLDKALTVTGSKSGAIAGKAELDARHNLVIFKPAAPLAPGETVSVRVDGVRDARGQVAAKAEWSYAVAVPRIAQGSVRVALKQRKLGAGRHTVRLEPTLPLQGQPAGVCRLADGSQVNLADVKAAEGGAWEATLPLDGKPANGPASLQVQATDYLGRKITHVLGDVNVEIDTQAPPAMAALLLEQRPGGKMAITWNRPANVADLAGYRIYRAAKPNAPEGERTLVRSITDAGTTACEDQPAADGEYFYWITAVDDSGNAGPVSEAARGVSLRAGPKLPVQDFALQVAKGQVTLAWKKSIDPQAVGYNLFRLRSKEEADKIDVGRPYRRMGIDETTTVDAPADGDYLYVIAARDAGGNCGPFSAMTPATVDTQRARATITLPAEGPLVAGEHIVTIKLNEKLKAPLSLKARLPNNQVRDLPITAKEDGSYQAILKLGADDPDGDIAFQPNGEDLHGNAGIDIAAGHWVYYDNAPPRVRVYNEPRRRFQSGIVRVTVVFQEPIVDEPTVAYKVGEKSFPIAVKKRQDRIYDGQMELTAQTPNGPAQFVATATDRFKHTGGIIEEGRDFVIDTVVPQPPSAVRVKAAPEGAVEVAWTSPAGESVDHFRLYAGSAADFPVAKAAMAQDNIRDLKFVYKPAKDQTPFLRVSAVDAAGNESPPSEAVRALADTIPPDAVAEVVATLQKDGQVKLAWKKDAIKEEVRFRIYRETAETLDLTKAKPVNTVAEVEVFDKPPGTAEYYYFVVAEDLGGNLSPVARSNRLVYDILPPTAALALDPVRGTLDYSPDGYARWTLPVINAGKFAVRVKFSKALAEPPTLRYRTRSLEAPREVKLELKDGQYIGEIEVVAGKEDGLAQFLFSAKDAAGNVGAQFTAGERFWIDTIAPRPPEQVKIERRPLGKIHVSWTAPPGEQLHWVRFDLYRSRTPITSLEGLKPLTRIERETSFLDSPAEEGEYHYAIVVEDRGANRSAPTPTVTAKSAAAPPAAPKQLAAAAAQQIALTWQAPPGDDLRYRVYRSTGAEVVSPANRIADDWREPAFGDLPQADGTYQYAVTAVDGSGNEGPASNVVRVEWVGRVPRAIIAADPPGAVRDAVKLNLTSALPLAEPPQLFLRVGGRNDPVAMRAADAEGKLWSGAYQVPPNCPNGRVTFTYRGVAKNGVVGTALVGAEQLTIDTQPPTAGIVLSRPAPLTDGTHPFTLNVSEPLAKAPLLTLTALGAAPRQLPLEQAGPTEYRGNIVISATDRDGAAVVSFVAADPAGNEARIEKLLQFDVDHHAPKPPTALAGKPLRAGEIELTWQGPIYTAAEPIDAIAGYDVFRSDKPITSTEGLTPVAARVRSLTHRDKPPADAEYHYAIVTVDASGLRSPASPSAAVRRIGTPPAPPRLTKVDQLPTGIAVAWECDGDPAKLRFRVTAQKEGQRDPVEVARDLNKTSVEHQPLEDGVYTFRVSAADELGNESELSIPRAISYKQIAPVARLSFSRPPPWGVGTVDVTVALNRAPKGTPTLALAVGDKQVSVALKGSGTQWTGALMLDAALAAERAEFRFKAVVQEGGADVEGTGILEGRTVELDFTPPTVALRFPPSVPSRDRLWLLRPGTLEFAVETSEPLAQAPKLIFTPQGQTPIAVSVAPGDPRRWLASLVITDAMPQGAGLFEIEAVDRCGNAAKQITEGRNVLLRTTVPAAITKLRAVALPGGRVRLDWTPPMLPGGQTDTAANHFRIYRSDGRITNLEGLTPLAELHRALGHIDAPPRDQEYHYTVVVLDEDGNASPPAPPVTVHVDKTPPAAPRDLSASELPTGAVKLMWKPPAGERAAFYRVYLEKFPIRDVKGLRPMADMVPLTEIYGSPNENAKYYFTVTAVDDALNEGPPAPAVFLDYKTIAPMAFFSIAQGAQGSDATGTLVIHTAAPLVGAPQLLVKGETGEPKRLPLVGAEKTWSARISPVAWFKPVPGKESAPYTLELVSPTPLPHAPKLVYQPGAGDARSLDFTGSGSRFTAQLEPKSFFRFDHRIWLTDGSYTVSLWATEPLREAPKVTVHSEHGQPRSLSFTGNAESWQATLTIDSTWKEGQYGLEFEGTDLSGNKGTEVREGPLFRVDRTPPLPPEKPAVAQAEQAAPGAVEVKWSPPQQGGANIPHYYRIYRAAKAFERITEAEMVKLFRVTETGRDTESLLDLPPGNGTWFYRVTSVDLAGNESGPSPLVQTAVASKTPVAEIRLFTKQSGDAPAERIGRGETRVVVQTNVPLNAPPLLEYLLKPRPTVKKKIELKGAGTQFEGTIKIEMDDDVEEDGEFVFAGTSDEGVKGTSIRFGRTFIADAIGPEARIIIPSVYEMKIAVKAEGGGELVVPPVKSGRIRVEVEMSEPAADMPELSYTLDSGAAIAVPLQGLGRHWHGWMDIPEGIEHAKGTFAFKGVDQAGNVSTKITRREYPRETDDSIIPRTIRNFATTGGEFGVDSVPPAVPRSLVATARKLGVAELRWENPADEKAAPWAYRLYRGLAPVTTRNGQTPIKADFLARVMVDDPPVDGNYFYAVTAVDLAGNESELSESASIFIDTIKPELKIKAVPEGEDFVILFPEEEPTTAELTLRFPGQKDFNVTLGGDSGELKRVVRNVGGRPVTGYVLPRQAQFFNGKVEVIVHSPDPEGNRVQAVTETEYRKISSSTGGEVSSSDGAAKFEIPPGLQPVIPAGPKETKRVKGYEHLYFISYERIPQTAAQATQADNPRTPDPLPPGLEVVGAPYTIHMNEEPKEPVELKASVTQADLSELMKLKPRLTMKIPEVYSDAVKDSQYLKDRLKVVKWVPEPENTRRRGHWELVPDIEIKPETAEIVAPADSVTTYVIVAERTPPSVLEATPEPEGAVQAVRPPISALIVDKGTGVATGAENNIVLAIDGQKVPAGLVKLSKDDPTEVRLSYAPPADMPPGVHLISIRAEDVVGNVVNYQWRFTISDKPPAISNLAPAEGGVAAAARPIVSAVLFDEGGIDPTRLELKVDGENAPSDGFRFDPATGLFTWSCNRDLPDGEHQINLAVFDRTGQQSTRVWNFIVDTEAPEVQPPVIEGTQMRIGLRDRSGSIAVPGLRLTVAGQPIAASAGVGKPGYEWQAARNQLVCPLPAGVEHAPVDIWLVAQDGWGNAVARGWRAGGGMAVVDLDAPPTMRKAAPWRPTFVAQAAAAPAARPTPALVFRSFGHRQKLAVAVAIVLWLAGAAMVAWAVRRIIALRGGLAQLSLAGKFVVVWQSAGEFLRAQRQSHQLDRRHAEAKKQLETAWLDMGTAAEPAGIGGRVPAFADVQRIRNDIAQATACVSERQAALQSASDELAKRSTADTAVLTETHAVRQSADTAASHADGELSAARKRLASIEGEIGQVQSRLASLSIALPVTEPADALAERLAELDSQRAELAKSLADAEQAHRDLDKAAKANAEEQRHTTVAWQGRLPRLRKDLEAAQALITPDRDASIKAAQGRLTEESNRHAQSLASLSAEGKRLAAVTQADMEKLLPLRAKVVDLTKQCEAARNTLEACRLDARRTELEAQRSTTSAEVERLAAQAAEAHQQADAAATRQRQAEQSAAEARKQGEQAVAAARAESDGAAQRLQQAQSLLSASLRKFGQELHERRMRMGPLAEPAARAEKFDAELSGIDADANSARSSIGATRAHAQTLALLAGGMVLVIGSVVVAWVMLRA